MLGYIYSLVRSFEKEHGFHPNLLYINSIHNKHLTSSFADGYSMQQIMNILGMEIIVDQEIIHPRVAWTHTAFRTAS